MTGQTNPPPHGWPAWNWSFKGFKLGADRGQVEGGGGCIELPAPWLREDFACAEIFPDHIDADIGFSLANLVELVAVNDAFCEGSDDPSQLGVCILIFGHDLVGGPGFDGPDDNRCQLIFNT